TALSISCRSTLLTTSNDESLAMVPPWCDGPRAHVRFAGRAVRLLSFHPHDIPAGYPSGQRGLTVNQLAKPTGVRIPHPPRAAASPLRGGAASLCPGHHARPWREDLGPAVGAATWDTVEPRR